MNLQVLCSLLFLLGWAGLGCRSTGHAHGTKTETLRLECLRATGTYGATTHVIDLHLRLRMRSGSGSPVVVYRLWEAIQADPVQNFVHWLPIPTDLKPTVNNSEAITIDARGAELDWVIPNWAGMRPDDARTRKVTARIEYQVGETKSNTVETRVEIVPEKGVAR